jgi:hypothetical protein
MRSIKRTLVLVTLTLFIFNTLNVFCQQKSTQPKVKSVTVYEESYDRLVTKKYKESETTYDSRGNIIEDIQYTDGKIDKHFQYQYDSADNKIKEIEFDSSGKVDKTSEYKYDKGLRIEKTVYDSAGKIKSKKLYIYTTY